MSSSVIVVNERLPSLRSPACVDAKVAARLADQTRDRVLCLPDVVQDAMSMVLHAASLHP
jgi:hypothetical protein